jgi:hypothetical protein
VSFVGKDQVSTAGTSNNPQVTIPPADPVVPGGPNGLMANDRLILVGSYAVAGASPDTPAGWTPVSSRIATGLESFAWTKQATAEDAGAVVSTHLSAAAKSTLTVAAYRGVAATDGIAAFASATDGGTTGHTSPTVAAPDGGWVVQLWTDKSPGTTSWTAPSGVTTRSTAFGAGTGRTSGLLADSGGPVSAGSYGGLVATTDATSGRAINWTFALQPD